MERTNELFTSIPPHVASSESTSNHTTPRSRHFPRRPRRYAVRWPDITVSRECGPTTARRCNPATSRRCNHATSGRRVKTEPRKCGRIAIRRCCPIAARPDCTRWRALHGGSTLIKRHVYTYRCRLSDGERCSHTTREKAHVEFFRRVSYVADDIFFPSI